MGGQVLWHNELSCHLDACILLQSPWDQVLPLFLIQHFPVIVSDRHKIMYQEYTVWQSCKKLLIELPYNLPISLLDMAKN